MSSHERSLRSADGEGYIIPGRQPVAEALRATRDLLLVVVDRRSTDAMADVLAAAESAGLPVRVSTRGEMDVMTGDVRHQGILAVAPPFTYAALDSFADADLVVVLDGITDPRNLGAIARVAEQVGAAGLVIRNRRAASPSPAAEKAAAGALSWLPVAAVTNISRCISALHDHGMWTVGLAGGSAAPVWGHPLMDDRVALVVGEEGDGLSRLVAEGCDALVGIPMAGHLDSLNASTATAIAAFEWLRRHRDDG